MNAHSVYHESFPVDWSTVTVHWSKPDMRKVREVATGFVIGLVFFALSFAFCVQAARAYGECEPSRDGVAISAMREANPRHEWVAATGAASDLSIFQSVRPGELVSWGVLCREYSAITTTIFVMRAKEPSEHLLSTMSKTTSKLLGIDASAADGALYSCVTEALRNRFGSRNVKPYDFDCEVSVEDGVKFLRVMIAKW